MNRHSQNTEMQQMLANWRGTRNNPGTGALADPFDVNPIRRSFLLVLASVLVIVVPWLIGDAAITVVMLTVGWLAATGIVIGVPVLVWSLTEAGVIKIRGRIRPSIDQLDISPRVKHILQRHGYTEIHAVLSASDEALILLSNMDQRGLREVRQAVSVWKYRRWQEQGFRGPGV